MQKNIEQIRSVQGQVPKVWEVILKHKNGNDFDNFSQSYEPFIVIDILWTLLHHSFKTMHNIAYCITRLSENKDRS